MDNFITTLHQLKNSEEEKYDVLYVNSPMNHMTPKTMSKMAIHDLSKKNSLLYIWADTYTLADTLALIHSYDGYTYECIYQVCDIATYPTQVPVTKTKVVKKVEASADSSGVEESKSDESKPEEKDTDNMETEESKTEESKTEEKKPPVKRVVKTRCPPLSHPKYHTTTARGSSRGTTEFLLLAYRGDKSVITELHNEKAGTLPYQVVRRPEMGKKSRSVVKKGVYLDNDWCVDRPECFLQTVQDHLKPDIKVLEIFGSTIRDNVDGLGVNIPGGFCPGYKKTTGLTGAMNKVMRAMRKVQLQSLVTNLTKVGQSDDRAVKLEAFKKVEGEWAQVKKGLADMKTGGIGYDWGSDDKELPCEWLRLSVLFFATKNVADFGNLNRRRKKRKSTGPTGQFGISAPQEVSKELKEFLGLADDEKVSRTQTVRLLNAYIKEKGLQNPDKKVELIPDAALAKVLGVEEGCSGITYFRICSYLTNHFPPSKKALAAKAKAEKEALASKENVENVVDVEIANKKARVE